VPRDCEAGDRLQRNVSAQAGKPEVRTRFRTDKSRYSERCTVILNIVKGFQSGQAIALYPSGVTFRIHNE